MKRSPTPALLLALVAMSCGGNPPVTRRGLNVAGDIRLVGAAVVLDGKQIGTLRSIRNYDSWGQRLIDKVFGENPMNMATLTVDLVADPHATGKHTVVIVQAGQVVASGSVIVPPNPEFQYLWVKEGSIEKPDHQPPWELN